MKKPTVKNFTFFGLATSNPEGPTPSVENNQQPFSKMPKNSAVMTVNQFFSKKTADILIHTYTRIQKKMCGKKKLGKNITLIIEGWEDLKVKELDLWIRWNQRESEVGFVVGYGDMTR